MLDFLYVPFAQVGEVGQFGLGHFSLHAKSIDVLADDLAPFHGLQLARTEAPQDAL
jgi:hypothetical protein